MRILDVEPLYFSRFQPLRYFNNKRESLLYLSLSIKKNPDIIKKKVQVIAEKLGILDILSKFLYEVSGGQKQRCACARALINELKLILADEPTGSIRL